MLELAMQETAVPEGAASFTKDALGASQRLIQLVNDLLDVSRLESGRMKATRQRSARRVRRSAALAAGRAQPHLERDQVLAEPRHDRRSSHTRGESRALADQGHRHRHS